MSKKKQTSPKPRPESAEVNASWKAEGSVEAFRHLGRRLASGEQLFPPVLLTGQARREHVRSTLREDHVTRIEQRDQGRARHDEIPNAVLHPQQGLQCPGDIQQRVQVETLDVAGLDGRHG